MSKKLPFYKEKQFIFSCFLLILGTIFFLINKEEIGITLLTIGLGGYPISKGLTKKKKR